MGKEYTQIDFENAAKAVHGNTYDYSEDRYKDMYTEYNVICQIHGMFPVKPVYHIHSKKGCDRCKELTVKTRNLKLLQEKIKVIHNRSYEPISCGKNKKELHCFCDLHGNYCTTKHMYINTNYGGCDSCKKLEIAEDFVNKATSLHGNKYTYKLTDYVSSRDEMLILCNKHQEYFPQRPSAHLQGQGCPICGKESALEKMTLSPEEFIQKCIQVHGEDGYDYNVTSYTSNKNECLFKCKIHGIFSMIPSSFISGTGCFKCHEQRRRETLKEELIHKVSTNPVYSHFDLSKIVYVNNRTPVTILCNDHNELFQVTPNKLLDNTREVGCKVCGKIRWNRWSLKGLLKIPNIKSTGAYIYYGKVSGLDGFKLGITKNLHHRYMGYKRDMASIENNFNYIKVYKSDYFRCAVMEVVLKKLFSPKKVKHDLDFGGKHEVFDIDKQNLLSDIFSGRFDMEFGNLANIVTGNNDPQLLGFVNYLKKVYKIE